MLGIRLFNGAAAVLKLCLSGYYQTAALQARDLLETVFLLDLFTADAASRGMARRLQRCPLSAGARPHDA